MVYGGVNMLTLELLLGCLLFEVLFIKILRPKPDKPCHSILEKLFSYVYLSYFTLFLPLFNYSFKYCLFQLYIGPAQSRFLSPFYYLIFESVSV